MNYEIRNKDVVVDLSNYTMDKTTLTSRNELIHLEQLDEVCRIIKEKIESAKDYNPNSLYGFTSQNDVISIFARRGAGKTTFVKSLVNLIRTAQEETFQYLRNNLYCVDVFEPNQMMNKENLLIRFLAQISEKIHEKEEERCCHLDCKDNYVKLRDARRKLYEALPVIDGVGKGNLFPDWDDNAYIADRYMNLASNAKELEKRFHNYIYTGLNVIGKKAILFVLDDSDVNIEKSFEILEIIRLFFTSPQIIVVLTGDASLYSMTVRRNYWQYFTKDFLEKDCDALDKSCTKFREYYKMVYRLEAQYIQKMIKAEHRIFLNNVYDKLYLNNLKEDKDKNNIYIKLAEIKGKNNIFEISKLYQLILEELDVNSKLTSIHNTYINHLLAQPFRNQLRLFTVYNNYRKLNKRDSEIFTKGLLKVFEVYINQLSGDGKYLMAHTPIYPAWLLKFLVDNQILNIGSSFLPVMESDSLKNAVSVLGLSCYEQIKHNPSIIFDFWIRISMTKQLSVFLGECILNDANSNLLTHAKLYSDNGLDNILSKMLTYCKNKSVNHVSIQTSIPGTIMRKGICCNPDSYKESCLEIKLINLLQIESVSLNKKSSFTYSLYRPLAVLGELLRTVSTDKEFNTFKNMFEQLSQVKLYVEPDVNHPIKVKPKSEKNNVEAYLEKSSEEINYKFLSELHEWSKTTKEFQVAPFFIDRIFSRYFDLMINYSNHLDNDEIILGDYINDAILAFWNAAIIEKLLLANQRISTLQSDENTILNVFFMNYIKIHELELLKKNHSLFVKWILECPLLKAYVDPFIQELMRMIDEKVLNDSDIRNVLNKHNSLRKQDIISNKLKIIDFDIERINSEITDHEEYLKIFNYIRSIENNIKIYESQLGSEDLTLRQKKSYQKEITQLIDERHELKSKLFKMGLYFEQNTPEEKLEKLYKELHELEDEKLWIELEDAKQLPKESLNDELFCQIVDKSKEVISVYPILKNL